MSWGPNKLTINGVEHELDVGEAFELLKALVSHHQYVDKDDANHREAYGPLMKRIYAIFKDFPPSDY